MGKKKFIDKKKSATYQLFARDSTDPNYHEGPSGDRIFVRVDNNPLSIDGFADEENEEDEYVTTIDPDSIFADAPDDEDDEEDGIHKKPVRNLAAKASSGLPDHVRKEILELGFPDDGYNYLLHMREIKNTGGGSAYYENSKAKLEPLPLDVKAYDASRVRIPGVDVIPNENSIYSVAAKTYGVRVQKAADPEVMALLDEDSDVSRFGSDVEDLEEDFVVTANLPEEGQDVIVDKKIKLVDQPEVSKRQQSQVDDIDLICKGELRNQQLEVENVSVSEEPRVRRLLDEQFDMLTLQEYGTESDSGYDSSVAEEGESLAVKLNYVLKDRVKDDFGLDGKYKVPADLLDENDGSTNGELKDLATYLIKQCVEYGKMYNEESRDNEDVVIVEESSDESEAWDCETIVSTYSNLDNHPGKIEAPGNNRKKKLAKTISAASSVGTHMIALRGKEKLPVDFLPRSRKSVVEKVNKEPNLIFLQQRKRLHVGELEEVTEESEEESEEENIENKATNGSGEERKERKVVKESKEEKKERKAAVKEQRREARKAKKEMKGLYKCETHRGQKVAAISGPSSIHLM